MWEIKSFKNFEDVVPYLKESNAKGINLGLLPSVDPIGLSYFIIIYSSDENCYTLAHRSRSIVEHLLKYVATDKIVDCGDGHICYYDIEILTILVTEILRKFQNFELEKE